MIVPLRRLAPLWMGALTLPTPVAQAQVVTIAMCGGTSRTITLPMNRPLPTDDSHDCCRKACHAGTDRRKKSDLFSTCC